MINSQKEPDKKLKEKPAEPDKVDEASKASFPASDPPAWTAMNVGHIDRKINQEKRDK